MFLRLEWKFWSDVFKLTLKSLKYSFALIRFLLAAILQNLACFMFYDFG